MTFVEASFKFDFSFLHTVFGTDPHFCVTEDGCQGGSKRVQHLKKQKMQHVYRKM